MVMHILWFVAVLASFDRDNFFVVLGESDRLFPKKRNSRGG